MTEKFKTIKIIHLALCAGTILGYIFIGDLLSFDNIEMPNIDSESMVYLIIPIAAIFLSNFLYKNQINSTDKNSTTDQKFGSYQTATIIRLAILEGATFAILFLRPDFIIFGILLIGYMLFLRPTENKFRQDFDIYDLRK